MAARVKLHRMLNNQDDSFDPKRAYDTSHFQLRQMFGADVKNDISQADALMDKARSLSLRQADGKIPLPHWLRDHSSVYQKSKSHASRPSWSYGA